MSLPSSQDITEKGCVYLIDFYSGQSSSSNKARPWIIIGRNNPKSSRVILSPISGMEHYIEKETNQLKYPYHAPLYKCDNSFLDKDSVILLDQAYTISKEELHKDKYIGKVDKFQNIDNAIMYNYDLFESIKNAFADLVNQYQNVHKSKYSRK
jgi:mRNA-degrading endonuclease toxin of MazEF toxin-antitoxin module